MEPKIDLYLKDLQDSLKNLKASQNSDECDFTDDYNCQDVVESNIELIENNCLGMYFSNTQKNKLRRLLKQFDSNCSFKKNLLTAINK